MYDSLVIHYGEIGLKGRNRDFFEQTLMSNIRIALGDNVRRVYKLFGGIACDLLDNFDRKEIIESLSILPGIEYFFFSKKTKLDMIEISDCTLDLLKQKDFATFKINAKRSNKNFEKSSMDLNIELGNLVLNNFDAKVKLKDPDVVLSLEINRQNAFLYLDRHDGIGGLPVGSSGKIISSLSGGIDSPVSSYMMMKRGCKVVFVHIFNDSIKGKKVISKIQDLVKRLSKVQLGAKLYIVPFAKAQRKIVANVDPKYRMIIYRRFMLRLINKIASKEKAKGIVTGDSVGQVASQTLDNIGCIYDVADIPLFNPLIGMNKEEIVSISKKIGTYEISIVPYPDCCSFMMPKSPETCAKIGIIKKQEAKIDNIDELIENCITDVKLEKY